MVRFRKSSIIHADLSQSRWPLKPDDSCGEPMKTDEPVTLVVTAMSADQVNVSQYAGEDVFVNGMVRVTLECSPGGARLEVYDWRGLPAPKIGDTFTLTLAARTLAPR